MNEILITSRTLGSGAVDLVSLIEHSGFKISRGESNHDLKELSSSLASATAWIAGVGPITKEHLDLAPNLKIIARYGVGVEAVDLEEATKRGIVVTNTPGANSDAVAELSVSLMLAALRHVAHGNKEVRDDHWGKITGQEIGGLIVGVIGFGRIGQGVAKRLSGFGSKLLAFDPFANQSNFPNGVTQIPNLDDLLREADVVSLHSPGSEVILTDERLALLKRGAVIVNTARAGLVDEQALANAIRERAIGAYAADVLSAETSDQRSPLLAEDISPYVTLTPHIGAQTIQAIDKMGTMAWANVQAVFAGNPAINPVYFEK